MTKKWGLIEKILKGEKTIESRWYKTKRAPWGKIKKDDAVYFKNSGEPVTAKAIVNRVEFIHLLDSSQTKIMSDTSYSTPLKIYEEYGERIGIKREDFEKTISDKKNKKYCVLIWLKAPQKIKPFNIDKTGYGISSAWMVVDDVEQIKA